MFHETQGWLALVCASALTLAGCGASPVQLGEGVESQDGTRYYWTTAGSPGARRLWEDKGAGEPVILDEGVFANVIGPLLSPGGAAWAVRREEGWTVRQVGVSDEVAHRSLGVGDALAAAWLLERLASGHPPGNAADLAQVGQVARTGRWPE